VRQPGWRFDRSCCNASLSTWASVSVRRHWPAWGRQRTDQIQFLEHDSLSTPDTRFTDGSPRRRLVMTGWTIVKFELLSRVEIWEIRRHSSPVCDMGGKSAANWQGSFVRDAAGRSAASALWRAPALVT